MQEQASGNAPVPDPDEDRVNEDRVSFCKPGSCQASMLGIACESCGHDVTHERHAVVTQPDYLVYSLCVPCARIGGIAGA